jgi:hypothetical protein
MRKNPLPWPPSFQQTPCRRALGRRDPRHPSTPPVSTEKQVLYDEWSADILKTIADKSSRGDKHRNTVGHLYHVGYIIPAARHSYPTTEVIRRVPPRLVARFPRASPPRNQPAHLESGDSLCFTVEPGLSGRYLIYRTAQL